MIFQQNIDLIYALFIGIMLSSVYLRIIGKVSMRIISKIADILHYVLYPIIRILCVFGSYAVNNSSFDGGVLLIMGAVAYAMLKLSISTALFLIAFIFGPFLAR